MIGNDPYGIRHAVRPGYGEPDPVEPVSTRDPQRAVDRCLGCTAEECFGKCKPGDGQRVYGHPARREKTRLRDEKVRDLIRAGWCNNDAICEEVGISTWTLQKTKQRLRERGELP